MREGYSPLRGRRKQGGVLTRSSLDGDYLKPPRSIEISIARSFRGDPRGGERTSIPDEANAVARRSRSRTTLAKKGVALITALNPNSVDLCDES